MTAFNGSGVLVRTYDWTDDRDAAVKINADRMDTEDDGIVAAINAILSGSQPFKAPAPFASGTAALPGITFEGDVDSGMYRIGADNYGFSAAGTLEAQVEAGFFDVVNGLKIAGTAVTATAAQINYSAITTLGTSEASKFVSADANGNVGIAEEIQAKAYIGTVVALSGTAPTINCNAGNAFTLTTSGNTTFTFDYSGIEKTTNAYAAFKLKVTSGGSHSLTWPGSVIWEAGTAPDDPASGETDVYFFETFDGGTTWIGVWQVDGAS